MAVILAVWALSFLGRLDAGVSFLSFPTGYDRDGDLFAAIGSPASLSGLIEEYLGVPA